MAATLRSRDARTTPQSRISANPSCLLPRRAASAAGASRPGPSVRGCRARPPGMTGSRAMRGPVGEPRVEADVADRLLLAAAVGAGDPGDRDGDVGVEALQRPDRHRLGDLGRDRALAARSASDRRPAAPPWPRSSRRRRRRRSTPRRPARSVIRAAIRPPLQDSASAEPVARAAASPPGRRSSRRRG